MGQRRNRFGFVPLRAPEPKFKRPLPVPSHLRTNDIPDEERERLQWESEAERANLARRERMSPLSRMVEDSLTGIFDFGKGLLIGGSDERPGMTAENAGELVQAGLPFAAYKNLGKLPFGQTFHGTQKWKPGEKIDFDRFDKSDVLGWMFHSAEDPEYAGRYAMGEAKGTWISPGDLTSSHGIRDPQGKVIAPQIIPLEIEAKNVLDLVDPNADDMSAALAALSPHKRADAIERFKNARRATREMKDKQPTRPPISDPYGYVTPNDYLENVISSSHVPKDPIDWDEIPVRVIADELRMSPKEFDQSPFDAIRYHDMDKKSWAVPSRTQIRSAINKEPLVNLPEELPSFRTLQSGGGKSYPRDPLLALDTQRKLDLALDEGMISREEYDMMLNEILLSTQHPLHNQGKILDNYIDDNTGTWGLPQDITDDLTGYSKNDIMKGKVPKNSDLTSMNESFFSASPMHNTTLPDPNAPMPTLGDVDYLKAAKAKNKAKHAKMYPNNPDFAYTPDELESDVFSIDDALEDFAQKGLTGSGNIMITGTDQIKVGKVYKVTKPDGNHFIFNTLDGGDAKALAEDFGQGFQIEEMSNTSLLDQYTADFAQKGLTGSGKKPWEGMGQGEKEIVDFLKLAGYLHKNTLEPTKKNIVNLEHLQKAANQENLTKPEIIYLADKYGIDHTKIKFKDNNFELENEPEFDPAYDIGSALGNFIADTPEAMADPFVAKYNALPDYSKTYVDNYLKNIGGPESLSKDTLQEAMIAGHLEKPEYDYLMDVLDDVHKNAVPEKNIMSLGNFLSEAKPMNTKAKMKAKQTELDSKMPADVYSKLDTNEKGFILDYIKKQGKQNITHDFLTKLNKYSFTENEWKYLNLIAKQNNKYK